MFCIIFANKELFIRLGQSIHRQEMILEGDPLSQAVRQERDVKLNKILFDVLAPAVRNFFTADMQRRYFKNTQENRTVYYICRTISTQKVDNGKYENVKPVHISFILTTPPEESQDPEHKGIRQVSFCYRDTGEVYSELANLYLVYVPIIVEQGVTENSDQEQKDLYVFARFFAIETYEDAEKFCLDFADNQLGKDLMSMYGEVLGDVTALEDLENSEYFVGRVSEEQLAEARMEGAARIVELVEQGYDLRTALEMVQRH